MTSDLSIFPSFYHKGNIYPNFFLIPKKSLHEKFINAWKKISNCIYVDEKLNVNLIQHEEKNTTKLRTLNLVKKYR